MKIRFEYDTGRGYGYCNYCDGENWENVQRYVPFNHSEYEEVDDETYTKLRQLIKDFNHDPSNYPYVYVMFEDGFEPRAAEALKDLMAYEKGVKDKKLKEAAAKKLRDEAAAAERKKKSEESKIKRLEKKLAEAKAMAEIAAKELDKLK